MDPAVLVVEGLQKDIEMGHVLIPNACSRLKEVIHEVAKDDSRQFFRQLLPKLLVFILGNHRSPYNIMSYSISFMIF